MPVERLVVLPCLLEQQVHVANFFRVVGALNVLPFLDTFNATIDQAASVANPIEDDECDNDGNQRADSRPSKKRLAGISSTGRPVCQKRVRSI